MLCHHRWTPWNSGPESSPFRVRILTILNGRSNHQMFACLFSILRNGKQKNTQITQRSRSKLLNNEKPAFSFCISACSIWYSSRGLWATWSKMWYQVNWNSTNEINLGRICFRKDLFRYCRIGNGQNYTGIINYGFELNNNIPRQCKQWRYTPW